MKLLVQRLLIPDEKFGNYEARYQVFNELIIFCYALDYADHAYTYRD